MPFSPDTDGFFAYARERHATHLRRLNGQAWPWTDDPVIREHRFTNVFRELDRTTLWFNMYVRGPLRDRPEVLPATVVFRWFNRITTGEAIFCQPALGLGGERQGETSFDALLRIGGQDGLDCLRAVIQQYCGLDGPYVTGAYTINTLSAGLGLTKLDGVINLIGQWFQGHLDWRKYAQVLMQGHHPDSGYDHTLEGFSRWCRSPCLGEFMTYEVACDLRHTALLARAPDVDTWANLGPGARRGLNRLHRGLAGKAADRSIPAEQALHEMRGLLAASRKARYWPQGDWPSWELREVEHTLCEFDKYQRVAEGSGRPRGRAPRG